MSIPTEVVVALITVIGGGIISLLLALMKVVLKVNDAVNERHKKVKEGGEIPPKLFDMVYESNQLIKDANRNLNQLTEKCKRIEKTIDKDIFPRLQTVESRQNFFVEALKEIKNSGKQIELNFADELSEELPEGDE